MRERDYPKFVSFPHHSSPDLRLVSMGNTVLSSDAWQERLAELDENEQADIRLAIQQAADLHSDVHLYRKRGSRFLGIGFQQGDGPNVKIWEHPEIAA